MESGPNKGNFFAPENDDTQAWAVDAADVPESLIEEESENSATEVAYVDYYQLYIHLIEGDYAHRRNYVKNICKLAHNGKISLDEYAALLKRCK